MKNRTILVIAMACMSLSLLAGSALAQVDPNKLNPPGPPGPTMKTLDQIPPTWDQTLRSDNSTTADGCNSSRFRCVMGGAAVLDKETGLVWERSPSVESWDWLSASWSCVSATTGGRLGWRLPTIQELSSLADLSSSIFPPAGSPFNLNAAKPEPDFFLWSATVSAFDASDAWSLFTCAKPDCHPVNTAMQKTAAIRFWCVRGGLNTDPQ